MIETTVGWSTGGNSSVDQPRHQERVRCKNCYLEITADSIKPGPLPPAPLDTTSPPFSISRLVAFLEIKELWWSSDRLKSLPKGSPEKMAAETSGPWRGFSFLMLRH